MEPSRRVQELTPSLTLAIDSKAKAMKAEGIDVIGFGAGEPDFDTPEHIKAAAMGSLDAGFTKYTPSSGIPELRTAISEKLKKDNRLDYKPSQIIVNCGAKHSCFNALLATLDEGDEVIIPAPYWLSYPEMVKLVGGVPVIVPTTAENGYKITPDQFRDAMTPRTKMIIINTPGNPTGAVYTENELAGLADVALDEDILILSDEIYEKLVYDDAKHISIATLSNDVYNLTLTVNGFSKPYAMTGWRLGYVAAPEGVAKVIDSLQSHSTSNPTSFAQKGALAAYKGPQDCVVEMQKEYDRRRKRAMELIDGIGRLSYVRPQGAFYILLNIAQTGLNSTQFAEQLLAKEKVAVVPGLAFGDDSTVRLSYATSMENIEQGLARIGEFVGKLS
ncbi:MAG: aspartate aminotransferase [Verrucomicrobia bacterium Tous-C9LFEB]|nr:MAG: aspartate aminotransferase [Verrucomicrobia bacterium Tous-C9LFEB]